MMEVGIDTLLQIIGEQAVELWLRKKNASQGLQVSPRGIRENEQPSTSDSKVPYESMSKKVS